MTGRHVYDAPVVCRIYRKRNKIEPSVYYCGFAGTNVIKRKVFTKKRTQSYVLVSRVNKTNAGLHAGEIRFRRKYLTINLIFQQKKNIPL